MPAKSQSGETSDDQFAAAAAALDVTNQNGVELNGHSKSVDRSSSLQHGGIFKRNRFKPRKRVPHLFLPKLLEVSDTALYTDLHFTGLMRLTSFMFPLLAWKRSSYSICDHDRLWS